MTAKTPWIGTSWKMNKTRAEARAFAEVLRDSGIAARVQARLFVIPPFTAIAEVASILAGRDVTIGAQNMHWARRWPLDRRNLRFDDQGCGRPPG